MDTVKLENFIFIKETNCCDEQDKTNAIVSIAISLKRIADMYVETEIMRYNKEVVV